jgi:hypothetical protein
MLSYLAYLVLRNSMEDEQKRASISAIYGIFAFVIMIVFIGILPRMTDSLHPGKGGNPGFNTYDLDNQMRMVFYPAVLAWILLRFIRVHEGLVGSAGLDAQRLLRRVDGPQLSFRRLRILRECRGRSRRVRSPRQALRPPRLGQRD